MKNKDKNIMRIRFLGAIGTVTGSCTLLEYNRIGEEEKKYYLVDAGAFEGESTIVEKDSERKKILKKIAKNIKIIFLTHAHYDHIGCLPDIIDWGFRGKVVCTRVTHELLEPMLTSVGDYNDKSRITSLLKKIIFDKIDQEGNFGFGKTYVTLDDDFMYSCIRTSHVLGSCCFYFQWTDENYPEGFPNGEKTWKYLYFSSDIGPVSDKIMANIFYKGHQTPYWDKYEKIIIMESTYGERTRNKDNLVERKLDKLKEIIKTASSERKTIIIPSFALDRAQQILFDLYCIEQNWEISHDEKIECNWSEIMKSRDVSFLLSDNIGKLFSELKDNVELREKIQNEFRPLLEKYKEEKFNMVDEETQKKAIEIFENNKINKPPHIIKGKSPFKFYFDSPLISKVNEIYNERLTDETYSKKKGRKYKYISDNFLDKIGIFQGKAIIDNVLHRFLIEVKNKDEKNMIEPKNNEKTNIIVSASGMCNEGKVTEYLKKYLTDENVIVILTGFQAKDTNGSLLMKLARKEYDENKEEKQSIKLSIKDKDIWLEDIKCKIEDMSEYYSGHADQEQLLDYITPDETKIKAGDKLGKLTVLLNHGTDEARKALKGKIEERNKNTKVILPEFNKWYNLFTFDYEQEDIDFDTETNKFTFARAGDIHLYFPIEYDEKKIDLIINSINELL